MQMQASEFFEKVEHLFHKYEERFSTFAFAFGFLLDNLTLTRIDLWIDMLILFIHLATAGVGIFLSNMRVRGNTSGRSSTNAHIRKKNTNPRGREVDEENQHVNPKINARQC